MFDTDAKHIIMLGDFNAVNSFEMDRSRITNYPTILPGIHNFFNSHNMFDCWWELNPNARDYTYYSARHKSYSQLDYIFVTQNIQIDITSTVIGSKFLSDHAPVIVCWRLKVSKKYNRCLNNALLMEDKYIEQIRVLIKEFFDNKFFSTRDDIVWNAFKAYFQGILIAINSQ